MDDERTSAVNREQEQELPSSGPAWDAAIAFGIDLKLLLANLALTPGERLRSLQRAADLHRLLRKARRVDE